MKQNQHETALRRLSAYRAWGAVACVLFFLVITLGAANVLRTTLKLPLLFATLLAGFAWIGATSVSRHAFVNAKRSIGKEATVAEFLLTQLAVPFFPILYQRLAREIRDWLPPAECPGASRDSDFK